MMTVIILIHQLDCSVWHRHLQWCWCHMQDLRFSHGVAEEFKSCGMWCCVTGQVPIFPRTTTPSSSMLNCITVNKKAQIILQNIRNFLPSDKITSSATLLWELQTLHCIHSYLPPLCSILLLSAAAFRWSASTITSCSAFCCSLVKLAVKTWYHSGSLAWMSVNIHTLSQQLRAPEPSLKNPQHSHWYVTVHNKQQPIQYLSVKLQKIPKNTMPWTQAVSCHL